MLGLIAFITSRGTLDKQYPHLRDAVAKTCDLVGAIRLPNTAFKQNRACRNRRRRHCPSGRTACLASVLSDYKQAFNRTDVHLDQ